MKKLMVTATLAMMLAGCKNTEVRVSDRVHVPVGVVESFTPKTMFGGYRVRITVGPKVMAQIVTNEVQAAAFNGDAILLLDYKQVQ